HFTDAGALSVDAGLLRANGDLGAVTGFTCERNDLDQSGSELRHLTFEQLAHETGVRARHDNLGPLEALGNARDIHSHSHAVGVLLARHLLLWGQNSLEIAQVDVHHALVGALLDDARNNLAFLVLER